MVLLILYSISCLLGLIVYYLSPLLSKSPKI
nr:MAG TPA: hypothetical protein [Crassvirales sp.]